MNKKSLEEKILDLLKNDNQLTLEEILNSCKEHKENMIIRKIEKLQNNLIVKYNFIYKTYSLAE